MNKLHIVNDILYKKSKKNIVQNGTRCKTEVLIMLIFFPTTVNVI